MLSRVSDCPIEGAMVLLSGRWRALILYYLSRGPMRFNALRRANAGISQQMLTRELRALETAGVIARTVFAEVPPRVEYALTGFGEPDADHRCARRLVGRDAARPGAGRGRSRGGRVSGSSPSRNPIPA